MKLKINFYSIIVILNLINLIKSASIQKTIEKNENKDGTEILVRNKRVVNGEKSKPSHHPYQVSIVMEEDEFLCSGVIIAPRWVLTAAHCVYEEDIATMLLRAGSNHRSKGGVSSAVIDAYYHEDYDPDTFDYDIALLRTSVNYGKYFNDEKYHIKPIQITQVTPLKYDFGILSGWGRTREERVGGVQKLKHAIMKIFPQSLCRKLNDGITNRMFCAGHLDGKTDACQGDSGGPLVSNKKLIGIVSWGEGCARPGLPSVYTNVYKLRDWIDYVIDEYSNNSDSPDDEDESNNEIDRIYSNNKNDEKVLSEIDDLNNILEENENNNEGEVEEEEDNENNELNLKDLVENIENDDSNDARKILGKIKDLNNENNFRTFFEYYLSRRNKNKNFNTKEFIEKNIK